MAEEKKISPLIRVSTQTAKAIANLSGRDGRSKSQLIEDALVTYYKTYPKARPPVKSRRGRKKKKKPEQ